MKKILLFVIVLYLIIIQYSKSKDSLEDHYELNANKDVVKLTIQSSEIDKFNVLIENSNYEILNMNKSNSDEIEIILKKKGD